MTERRASSSRRAKVTAEVHLGAPVRVAEIKRMYVRPRYRGRGLARALLMALEREAVGIGATVARLDTGPKQALAMGLYARSGYREIGNWNGNPHATYWGEKHLKQS